MNGIDLILPCFDCPENDGVATLIGVLCLTNMRILWSKA